MSRIFDTPDLFGCGVGGSTGCEVICEFCGKTHNKGIDVNRGDEEGDSILFTDFAGKQIAECCFEKVEDEILRRMQDILPWYAKMLKMKRDDLQEKEKLLKKCISALGDK